MPWFNARQRLRSYINLIFAGAVLSIAVTGCATYTLQPSPNGDHTSRIVDRAGTLLCSGQWTTNGPDGPWDFFQSNGDRRATLTFKGGVLDGPVRCYWGGPLYQSALGKIQVVGTLRDGQFDGRWTRYAASGALLNESVYQNGRLISARSYSQGIELPPAAANSVARRFEVGDRQFFDGLVMVTRNVGTQRP
jgi:hypothetical protein